MSAPPAVAEASARRPAARPGSELYGWSVFAAVALVGWETAARLYAEPYLLPAPSQMLGELRAHWPLVLDYSLITLEEVVLGFAIGSAAALLGAMLFLWLPGPLEDFLYRVVVTLNSTPF